MDNKTRSQIEYAIDSVIEEFYNDQSIVFSSENEQLGFINSAKEETLKWKNQRECLIHDCRALSIKRSHAIQKSGAIKTVSENGHVLSPIFDFSIGNIVLKKLGVNHASTFPGYCVKHEALFQDFESNKEIKDFRHVALQVYRTICREIVINTSYSKSNKEILKNYLSKRNNILRDKINNKLPEELQNGDSEKWSFTLNDFIEKAHLERQKSLDLYLSTFLKRMEKFIRNDLRKDKPQKLFYQIIDLNYQIPVALAGKGNFVFISATKSRNIDVIFNVLPSLESTKIIICSEKKNKKAVEDYVERGLNSPNILNIIESWMIHGSDHWFLKESIWDSINVKTQNLILERLKDNNYNIGDLLDYSIFNNVRSYIISILSGKLDSLDDLTLNWLKAEKKKLEESILIK